MSRHRLYVQSAFVLVVLAVATHALAQKVLIDLGTDVSFRGLSVINPDDNGNYWNSVDNSNFFVDLVDTTNTPTSIDLGFDGNFPAAGTDSYNGPAGPTDSATIFPFTLQQWCDLACDIDQVALGDLGGSLNAGFDYFVNARFQLQQLDPAKLYDISFYGSHKFNVDNNTSYSVFTDNAYTQLAGTVDLEVGVDAAHNRDTVATISSVPGPLNDNNIFYVDFIGSAGNNGYLNAMSIEEVGDYTPSVVELADFGDFYDLDGLLPDNDPPDTSWGTNATITPGANALNVSSTGSGGGFDILPAKFLNATATDTVELVIDITAADSPNVVALIEDGDGTQQRYDFSGLGLGQHVLTAPISSGTVGSVGSVPGLDLTDIFAFQISVETGETTSYDIDFVSLKLIDGPNNIPGDANGDGTVDLLDLDILGTNFGLTPATFAQGDFNGDGTVDLLDLDILGTNFGATSSAAIPEPASGVLLLMSTALFFSRRK